MNAFSKTAQGMATTQSRDAKAYMAEDQYTMNRRLNDAIAVYANGYEDLRLGALCAIALGRAAFWTTSSYSACRTVDLPMALHRGLTIAAALEDAFPNWCAADRHRALDTLVPLNRKATTALANAYARFGSWRDEEELEMRALRDTRRAVKREPLTFDNFVKSRGQEQ